MCLKGGSDDTRGSAGRFWSGNAASNRRPVVHGEMDSNRKKKKDETAGRPSVRRPIGCGMTTGNAAASALLEMLQVLGRFPVFRVWNGSGLILIFILLPLSPSSSCPLIRLQTGQFDFFFSCIPWANESIPRVVG